MLSPSDSCWIHLLPLFVCRLASYPVFLTVDKTYICICIVRNYVCVSLCAGQLCGEGWHHVGEACLRINSSRESYDNAQHYCKNLGGNIASLLTDKQVNFVLEELQKYQLQDKVGGSANKKNS